MRVIHAVTGPDINSQLANAIAQGLVITNQPKLNTRHAFDDGYLCNPVSQGIEPNLIKVAPSLIEIVDDFMLS